MIQTKQENKNRGEQKRMTRIVASFLVFLFLFSVPLRSHALVDVIGGPANIVSSFFGGNTSVQQTTQTGLKLKDVVTSILKAVGRSLAKKALGVITNEITTFVNTGSFGNPLFVQDQKSYFHDIYKDELKNFIGRTGYDAANYPFGKTFALGLVKNQQMAFENKSQYTLDAVIKSVNPNSDSKKYLNDFSMGGWTAWDALTTNPANNPIGYSLLAQKEVSKQINGPSSKINDTKDKLTQGKGFLPQQICLSNSNYKPDLTGYEPLPYKPTPPNGADEETYNDYMDAYNAQWNKDATDAKKTYEADHNCSSFSDTTPGGIISDLASKSLGSAQDQVLAQIGTGDTLSGVFESLISNLTDKGLASLSTKTSGSQAAGQDQFNYYGETLNVAPIQNINGVTHWNGGSDQIITLQGLKGKIDQTIQDTQEELNVIDNTDPNNPGIIQVLGKIPASAQNLDVCMPGPDLGWETRLDREIRRVSTPFYKKEDKSNEKKAGKAASIISELNYAVNFYKDWVKWQQITEWGYWTGPSGASVGGGMGLPSSVAMIDAINQTKGISDKRDAAQKARMEKTVALARLKDLQNSLPTSEPAPGAPEATKLLEASTQYNNLFGGASDRDRIDQRKKDRDDDQKILSTLNDLLPKCRSERDSKQFNHYGGENQQLNGNDGTEKEKFCQWPFTGGAAHGIPPGGDDYGDDKGENSKSIDWIFAERDGKYKDSLPLVNGSNVYNFKDIDISCDIVFPSTLMDYLHAGDSANAY